MESLPARVTRRSFLKSNLAKALAVSAWPAIDAVRAVAGEGGGKQPNILVICTDQQRFDTIRALGNSIVYTPNYDRLVRRGAAFLNAYSQCPVCVPARCTMQTGCESATTGIFQNGGPKPLPGKPAKMTDRCGPYLATVLGKLGYRTFGIGKFHTHPWDEALGYEVQLHGEEVYGSPDQRRRDSYAAWLAKMHPEFDWLEGVVGERTEMYYEPQRGPLPAADTIESWAADEAIRLINLKDGRPYFGFVSFIGPHPPLSPPIPFNRMYDPDRMPNPVRGDPATDHMDDEIPWMNHAIWADDINDPQARVLRSRYYGEISYIDSCIGRMLDAVEARGDGDNTLIVFFSDHGDLFGDHNGWQKECYFEGACHVPFLLSWPARIRPGQLRNEFVCHADLFGIATRAAGRTELREGIDVLGLLEGTAAPRKCLFGYYGWPGGRQFKIMARSGDWKYIFMANGGREQLFNLRDDPQEVRNLAASRPDLAAELRAQATARCRQGVLQLALQGGQLRRLPFQERPRQRIYQFDRSKEIYGFPHHPEDVLKPGPIPADALDPSQVD